jgi:glucose-1-phosphate cytidylyltransferase
MIPVGNQPILHQIMDYYAGCGHTDFVLCLGYKANAIKDYFLTRRQQYASDILLRRGGQVEFMNAGDADWSVAMIDTGIWRNVGERLCAVRHLVRDEEIFLANYSDALTDAPLDEMIKTFRASDKVACFLAVHPMLTFHLVDMDSAGGVRSIHPSASANIWINGGYFIFRQEIFDYIQEGEELVEAPFTRLIAEDKLMAYRYEGFWRPMDTLRDREALERMVEQGDTPWRDRGVANRPVRARPHS